jgi:hypothetical protein
MPNQPAMPKDDPEGRHLRPKLLTLPEPAGNGQDPDALDDQRVLSLITTHLEAGRGPLQAATWARGESEHRTRDWTGQCGVFVRSALDIPPRDPSAIAMWFGADPDARHPMTDPDQGDPGHPFIWSGGEFGHIGLLAWPFPAGKHEMVAHDIEVLTKLLARNERLAHVLKHS